MTTLTKLSQILELKFATENWKLSEEQMSTIRKAFKETVREWLTQKLQERERDIKAATNGIDNASLS
jgi:undecaprenyl pyrophosphate synthase